MGDGDRHRRRGGGHRSLARETAPTLKASPIVAPRRSAA
jgi:hypothetical protein